MTKSFLKSLFLLVIYLDSTIALSAQTKSDPTSYQFDKFTSFRHEILNLIGAAKKQVIITTDYLTDGEIVTALYLAKYRGISVKIFLGAQKANHYMSRLTYLKRQKIKVYLTPPTFPVKTGTIIIVDQKIFRSKSSLDYRTVASHYSLTRPKNQEIIGIVKSYQSAFKSPVIATPRPRVQLKPRVHHKPRVTYKARSPSSSFSEPGVYNYDRYTKHRIPDDVPNKLPKIPKFQIIDQNEKQE